MCINVYNVGGRVLKRKDLIKSLEQAGFIFLRNGSNHDLYVRGEEQVTVPRHREIKEPLAKAILKKIGL